MSDLASDETAALLPDAAFVDGDAWVVPVRAWVFEPEVDSASRALLVGTVRRALGVAEGSDDELRLRHRAGALLADSESGKALVVEVADVFAELPATDAAGLTAATVRVPLSAWPVPEAPRSAAIALRVPRGHAPIAGEVHLVPPTGLSVISDIDDTVKISEVRNRDALIANTLYRPMQAVPGMATRYAAWAAGGAAFHYVSGSPWQLHAVLGEFLGEAGLPLGSLALRRMAVNLRDLAALGDSPRTYKAGAIAELFARFPARRFVLIGDSGEEDPEVYADAARAHPGRVVGIYIRDVTGEPATAPRYQRVFAGLGGWQIFVDAAELPEAL